MKQFIWLLCGIFLSGLLLGSLSACGADQFGTVVMTTGGGSEANSDEVENGDGPDSISENGGSAPVPPADEEARRLAYGGILWDAYLKGVLPDGTELDRPGGELLGPLEGNEFALADVDGDGEEELLLCWVNASMAGMQEIVFGFRAGAVYQELSEFPALTFYDNGAVQADWSHNQGWAGRIWPYTVYQYDPVTGVYSEVGAVDAWDRAITDEDHPSWFPHEVDADGDGLIYYLLSGDWTVDSHTGPDGNDYYTWAVDPVDGDAYQRWRDSWFGGANVMEVPFRELTEETIAALGAPRPDVTYPEPAG